MLRFASIYAVIATIGLTACSSSNGTFTANPSPTPSPANISGDYTGSITDAQTGSGTVAGTLAQHGGDAGGAMNITQTSITYPAQFAISITPANSTSGSIVINYGTGVTCTFSTTGTYSNNGTTAVLSGTYSAVTNCAGDSGSYTLDQQCTDTVTAMARRRSMIFPRAC